MRILYLITALMFPTLESCSGQQSSNSQSLKNMISNEVDTTRFDKNSIETNFPLARLDDINMKRITFNGEFNYHIPFSILSNVFLMPVNEIIFSKSYIKNIDKTYFRYKISDDVLLLAYHHHYNDHDYDVIWTLFDMNTKNVTSKIVVEGFNSYSETELGSFDGQIIKIYTKYRRHMENGMEGDNSKPIEIESAYLIKNGKFVAK